MRTNAVAAGLLVALAVLAVASMGVAVADSHGNETEANVSENASVGAEVSSFMQASTAEAEGEVDDGMFEAALNRTDDPEERTRLVENRTQRLEDRRQRLEDRRAAMRGDGGVRDRALAVGVAIGADRLERSVNDTETVAASVGVDTERLSQLRNNARNLSGGEVSELARGLGGPPETRPGGGPPADSPTANTSDDRPAQAGNASEDGPEQGPPGERSQSERTPGSNAENASERGVNEDGPSRNEESDGAGGNEAADEDTEGGSNAAPTSESDEE